MIKEIINEIKITKDLDNLLKQYDPYVDYIDDGKTYKKVKAKNNEIEKEFKKRGLDIRDFIKKNKTQTKQTKQTQNKNEIKFVAISKESISKYKNAKKCGEVNDFLNVLDKNDILEFNKYGNEWPIAMWEVKNNEVGTIVITKSAVLCEGNKKLINDILNNFEKYYNLLKKEGFNYKTGWAKSIPL